MAPPKEGGRKMQFLPFILAIVALVACGAVRGPLAVDAAQFPVTSVVGFHSGKCGPKRMAEIAKTLSSLTAADLSWKARCKCSYATYLGLLRTERLNDARIPHGDLAYRDNFLTINFEKPISLPAPKSKMLALPVWKLVIMALPRTSQTEIYIGYRGDPGSVWASGRNTPDALFFVGYKILDDRFGLGHPGEECTASHFGGSAVSESERM